MISTAKPHKQLEDYEIQIGDSFILNAKNKLGSGAFGVVYLGYNIKQNILSSSTKANSTSLSRVGLESQPSTGAVLKVVTTFSSWIP